VVVRQEEKVVAQPLQCSHCWPVGSGERQVVPKAQAAESEPKRAWARVPRPQQQTAAEQLV